MFPQVIRGAYGTGPMWAMGLVSHSYAVYAGFIQRVNALYLYIGVGAYGLTWDNTVYMQVGQGATSYAGSPNEPRSRTRSSGIGVFPGQGIYARAYKGRPLTFSQVRALDQSSGLRAPGELPVVRETGL